MRAKPYLHILLQTLLLSLAGLSPTVMAQVDKPVKILVGFAPGGSADIWFAADADNDGVAESLGRWATMSTRGAEPTGLYFDKFNPGLAYVNVQHPDSGVDRLIAIQAVPEPETYALMGAGLGLVAFMARRRRQQG